MLHFAVCFVKLHQVHTKGTDFQRNSRSWQLDGHCKVKGIEHIYPTTKPPILEIGFSEYSDL
jgi:hypothetical protein